MKGPKPGPMPAPPLGGKQTDTVRNTHTHTHFLSCPSYAAPTWTPAAEEDKRVEHHSPVHQSEGCPLLAAKVTAWGNSPPVDTTGIDHEDLEAEEEQWLRDVPTSFTVSRSCDWPWCRVASVRTWQERQRGHTCAVIGRPAPPAGCQGLGRAPLCALAGTCSAVDTYTKRAKNCITHYIHARSHLFCCLTCRVHWSWPGSGSGSPG